VRNCSNRMLSHDITPSSRSLTDFRHCAVDGRFNEAAYAPAGAPRPTRGRWCRPTTRSRAPSPVFRAGESADAQAGARHAARLLNTRNTRSQSSKNARACLGSIRSP